MKPLVVVDFGGGNLGSLCAALGRRGALYLVSDDPEIVEAAPAAIVPGDGAFGATLAALRARALDIALLRLLAAERPVLAICVGMQLFYEASDEFGEHRGLAFLPGRIARFGAEAPRIPHMGWNRLEVLHEHAFVRDLGPAPYAYFLHSFRAPVDDATLVTCEHGERFAAIVARGSLVATQFHPEKSQATGARLLENFLGIVSGR